MYWVYKCWAGKLKNFWYLSLTAIILMNSRAVYWGIDKHITNLSAKYNSKSFSLWRTWLLGGKIMPYNWLVGVVVVGSWRHSRRLQKQEAWNLIIIIAGIGNLQPCVVLCCDVFFVIVRDETLLQYGTITIPTCWALWSKLWFIEVVEVRMVESCLGWDSLGGIVQHHVLRVHIQIKIPSRHLASKSPSSWMYCFC